MPVLTSWASPASTPQIQQADPGAQLAAGDVGALGRRTNRVVELDSGVPERIPEVVGERVCTSRSLPCPSCSSTRSRSDRGPSSRRARLPTPASATPEAGPPASAYSSTRADSTHSVIKRRRSGPAVGTHADRIATLRRSLVKSRFRARPARARPFARGRFRPPEPTRPCRHRCGRSERS